MSSRPTSDAERRGGEADAREERSYFERDGDAVVPTRWARSVRGDHVQGGPACGLIAAEMERACGADDLHPARLTVDLLRPIELAPLVVEVAPERLGRRLLRVETVLRQAGIERARAVGVFLKPSEPPPGKVAAPPEKEIVTFEAVPTIEVPGLPEGFMSTVDLRPVRYAGGPEPALGWVRMTGSFFAGEETTPFVRAAALADFSNIQCNMSDSGLNYLNVDVSLYLHRLPTTEWVAMEIISHGSARGVSVGDCALHDPGGPFGLCAIAAVAAAPDSRIQVEQSGEGT